MNPDQSPVIRKGFGLRAQIDPELKASYESPLIDRIKKQAYVYVCGSVTIHLAEEFGFCYGVDRAIEMVYETKARFPDRKIYLTDEIIHNPHVNIRLAAMGIQFLAGPYRKPGQAVSPGPGDIAIIPAFGTPVKELEILRKKGCVLVDTTCGSVMSVWKRVEAYHRDGFTAVIHGKFDHPETQATASRAGRFIVVRDKFETRRLCDGIEGVMDGPGFLAEFGGVVSNGFDPSVDLQAIGIANQTTMLSGESLEIANMLRDSVAKKFGAGQLEKRFRHFDTICSATQDRQNAVIKLMDKGIGLMIVVGGFNSSNTVHLVEISGRFCPVYHVEDAGGIVSANRITHRDPDTGKVIESEGWLPEDPVAIGVTGGASTPNRVIEQVIFKILEAKGVSPEI